MKKYKTDIIIITILFIFSLALFLIKNINSNNDRALVFLSINGELYNTYPLNVDNDIIINSEFGSNNIKIENNSVCVYDADCKDKLCVNQNKIFNNNESIICLPNRLVISIINNKGDIDAVSY